MAVILIALEELDHHGRTHLLARLEASIYLFHAGVNSNIAIFIDKIGIPVSRSADTAHNAVLAVGDIEIREIPLRRKATDRLAQTVFLRHLKVDDGAGIVQTNLNSVDSLARALSLSRSQLFRIFRDAVGHSPKEALTRHRCDQALRLIQHTSLSMEEIAAACCFTSGQHLCDTFRRQGLNPPSSYRK